MTQVLYLKVLYFYCVTWWEKFVKLFFINTIFYSTNWSKYTKKLWEFNWFFFKSISQIDILPALYVVSVKEMFLKSISLLGGGMSDPTASGDSPSLPPPYPPGSMNYSVPLIDAMYQKVIRYSQLIQTQIHAILDTKWLVACHSSFSILIMHSYSSIIMYRICSIFF